MCHLAHLEVPLQQQLQRLRRNVLKLLGLREFAPEAVWTNPSLTYTLRDCVCGFCGHCADLDVCRSASWACEGCANPYALRSYLRDHISEIMSPRSCLRDHISEIALRAQDSVTSQVGD